MLLHVTGGFRSWKPRTSNSKQGLKLLPRHLQRLAQEGRVTSGTVIDPAQGSHKNVVNVRYIVNGQTYTIRNRVAPADAAALGRGATVRVAYLPAYPHTARIAQNDLARLSRMNAVLGVLTLGCFLWSLSRLRAERREDTNTATT